MNEPMTAYLGMEPIPEPWRILGRDVFPQCREGLGTISNVFRGEITDWHGNKLGTYRPVSRWSNPNGWTSAHIYAITATIDGIRYHGRTCGEGTIVNLYPYRNQ